MTGILAVFTTFLLYVLTHWSICRFARPRSHSRTINVLWACFLPIYPLIFLALANRSAALAVDVHTVSGAFNLLNGLLLDCLLLVGYTYFFFLIERGISLRLILEVARSPQGKLTIEDIKKIYTYDYILEKRLGQMLKMGYMVKEGDYICNTEKGSKLAKTNKLVRKILRLKQVMP